MTLKMSTKITCTRLLHFDTGHRLYRHEGKCAHLHGHRYTAEITAEAESLDAIGRIVDFSVIKEKVGGWIDRNWDHAFVFWSEDIELISAFAQLQKSEPSTRFYKLPMNPTAENMASYLLLTVCPQELQGTGVTVTHVRLWETENCFADAYL